MPIFIIRIMMNRKSGGFFCHGYSHPIHPGNKFSLFLHWSLAGGVVENDRQVWGPLGGPQGGPIGPKMGKNGP